MTAPLRTFLSFVRTKAPPLPGFTCWNSTTLNRPSGRSRLMPFFRSLVETAMDVLRESGECAGAVLGDDKSGGEDSSAQLGHRGRFVDIEPDAVTGAVLEAVGPAGIRDDLAADVVDLFDADARPYRSGAGRLGCLDDFKNASELAGGVLVDAERARHVGAIALEGGAEVHH